MPRFFYKVKDGQSKTIEGIVEATNVKHALSLLHEKGFFVVNIKEQSSKSFWHTLKPATISFHDLVHITRQLSTMITAGLSLDEALLILIQQTRKSGISTILKYIEEEVRSGKTFSGSLEKYPLIFPAVYIALVQAGEASGKLDVILGRLADNLEKTRDFRNRVKSALVYPSIVVTGMVIVAIIVMTIVVPRLTSLYKEFGISLPLPTQILIFVSSFLVKMWWLMIILLITVFVLFLRMRVTRFGRFILSTVSLNLPVFGNLVRQATLVEVTKTLGLLVDGGVPILTSLEIAQNATNNILYQDAFSQAAKRIEKGFPLSEPLMENKIFPSILGQMVAVGEHTGKLGDSLFKLSGYFEAEAETVVRNLTTLIEPLIMVVLGLGVGFLVLAVLLPIYSLTSKF